jgi:hypothetical protein
VFLRPRPVEFALTFYLVIHRAEPEVIQLNGGNISTPSRHCSAPNSGSAFTAEVDV